MSSGSSARRGAPARRGLGALARAARDDVPLDWASARCGSSLLRSLRGTDRSRHREAPGVVHRFGTRRARSGGLPPPGDVRAGQRRNCNMLFTITGSQAIIRVRRRSRRRVANDYEFFSRVGHVFERLLTWSRLPASLNIHPRACALSSRSAPGTMFAGKLPDRRDKLEIFKSSYDPVPGRKPIPAPALSRVAPRRP